MSEDKNKTSVLVKFLYTIVCLLVGIGFILIGIGLQIKREFGPISIPQMLMNLPQMGANDTLTVAPDLVRGFVINALVVPLLVTVVVILLGRTIIKSLRKNGFSKYFLRTESFLVSILVSCIGLSVLDSAISWQTYFFQPVETELVLDNFYQEPELRAELPADKNLFLIYLESMDDAFGDEDLVEFNALESLQNETSGWGKMKTYTQIPDFGAWTIAGVVASQCGVPLRSGGEIVLSNDSSDDIDKFLPNAVCLGDVLEDAGYKSVFLSGADKAFAGKGSFLTAHGFSEVKDANYWRENGETEFSAWGLSDSRLFERAKEEALALRETGSPFLLSMITLDNHAPVANFESCPSDGMDDFLKVVECQSDIVADYISFLDDNGFLEDSVVVLVGDHQVLPSYPVASYREVYEGSENALYPIFNRFWSPTGDVEFRRDRGYQVDLYPTILELMGADLVGGRGGIGVSMFTTEEMAIASESIVKLDQNELSTLMQSRSPGFYEYLWDED